jgi:hypothetical protein
MARKFTIPKFGFEGLAVLAQLGAEQIVHLEEMLKSQPLTLDLVALAKNLAAKLENCSSGQIETAIRGVLIPLNDLRTQFRVTPERFLSYLNEEVSHQAEEKWKKDNHDRWQTIGTYLASLLKPDSYFSILGKAFDLLVNRPAITVSFKILSELRPVYDDEGSKTRAMLLTNTLVVEYLDANKERRTLHLTVDMDDLRTMKDELERAQRKNQLLQKDGKALQVDVLTAGEMGS